MKEINILCFVPTTKQKDCYNSLVDSLSCHCSQIHIEEQEVSMDLRDRIGRVFLKKPTNLSNLLLKTMIMIFFMILFFYIPDTGSSVQTYGPSYTPGDWIDNWTLRPPETIMTEGLSKRASGDTGFDVSTGLNGSIYIVWESMNNIMFSERQPSSRAFSPSQQLNFPGSQGIEPRVCVGDDGTVHVIWL